MDKQVSARMTIRKGKLDGLHRQAAAIIRQMDAKKLRFDWFLNADERSREVLAYGIHRIPGRHGSWRAEP